MARMKLRPGPVGVAITLYDVWRRLPPKQRKQLLRLARRHGPRVAAQAFRMSRNIRSRYGR